MGQQVRPAGAAEQSHRRLHVAPRRKTRWNVFGQRTRPFSALAKGMSKPPDTYFYGDPWSAPGAAL
jgi:hypothetical protein